jgi:cytochrome oxidase Cu insertion factor (SCO1/SenC/PrrC family)
MMKLSILPALLIFISLTLSLLAFKKPPGQSGNIPPFKILQTNGTYFSATDLPKGKPVIIIYFAPDCEHCQVLMNGLFKKINELKSAELVLVTFKPIEEVAGFEKSYGTKNYPNIKVGTEGTTFFLRYYYRIQNTPFTALYDKNGKGLGAYRVKTDVDDLIRRVKALQ